MPVLRSLRTLNALESGTLSPAGLEARLTDAGHLAEFTNLLSTRGQTRRMAANSLTMSAIVGSQHAHTAVFGAATSSNSTACQAVVNSSAGAAATAGSISTIAVVAANTTSWPIFSSGIYYEVNVKNVIANLSGVNPATYPTVSSIINDPSAMGLVAASDYGMAAVVASVPSVSILAADGVAMGIVANNTSAISTVAKKTAIMSTIASSTAAMTEIIGLSGSTSVVSSEAGAIQAIAANPTAWAAFKAGSYFAANVKAVVVNLVGGTPSNYADMGAVISDSSILGLVANSTSAVEALLADSSAITTLASHVNLTVITSSATAMAVVGADTGVMTTLLNTPSAIPALFASSAAKGAIVSSSALVAVMESNDTTKAYLAGISVTATPASTRSATTSYDDTFDGIPSKVLVIGMRANNIGAIAANYDFDGSTVSGSNPGFGNIALKGTVTESTFTGYIDPTWTVAGIGATAAVSPVWTYVDMT